MAASSAESLSRKSGRGSSARSSKIVRTAPRRRAARFIKGKLFYQPAQGKDKLECGLHSSVAMKGLLRYSAWTIGGLAVLVLVLIGILSLTKSNTVRQVIAEGDHRGPPPVSDSLFLRSIELYTGTHIEPGNKVELLLNGDGTYPPLWRDLAAARQSITVQLYFCQPGVVADSMSKYLIDRARAGVRVLLLLDAFGAAPLGNEWMDRLRAAKVEVALLRPLKWYSLHKAVQRSHVRAIVIDGKVGYTGGFGLADYWLGDGRTDGQWRESNIRFEGPTVAALQAAFAAGWAEATGELLTGDMFFPATAFSHVGNVKAGLMHTIPSLGSTPAERFLALSIAGARHTLYVANSYFVPDENFRRLLIAAARRGVDVRILTVGDKTDVKTTWYAGRSYYDELIRGGVRIYEYQPTMMHAKSMVVDAIWASVGTMNFDNRSMSFNNETMLVALDPGFGRLVNDAFLEDLRLAREVTPAELAKRSWLDRVLETVAEQLWRVL
jgi:cardiolipin synthase A/B